MAEGVFVVEVAEGVVAVGCTRVQLLEMAKGVNQGVGVAVGRGVVLGSGRGVARGCLDGC